MKVVLDTSVLFAAFASPSGLCADVVERCIEVHELILSTYLVDELTRILRDKHGLSKEDIELALQTLDEACAFVDPAAVPDNACRDSNDLPVLGTALAAKAEVLVTGDKDLLVLGAFAGILILSPRQFYDRFLARL